MSQFTGEGCRTRPGAALKKGLEYFSWLETVKLLFVMVARVMRAERVSLCVFSNPALTGAGGRLTDLVTNLTLLTT